jgi:hypothetical protein
MQVERRVSTQDISWFLDLHFNKQLDLDPPYQRRSVWSPKDRRFFLDTIFHGYPSPSIFLHKQVKSGKTVYYVVDGKQRLETILRFAENRISIASDFGDVRLSGKRWKTIKQDDDLARTFLDYVIPVEQTNIIETTLVNEVFDRMNRNARKLVEQELRHAKYEGWFISFVENESESPDWEVLGVVTTARAKRMRDVQFLSELLIVLIKGQVGGFDQEEITNFYAKYDNLSDLENPFDEEAIKSKFNASKDYLLKLEANQNIVTQFASDFTNFYSLWAVVCLNIDRLPSVDLFKERYSTFMQELERLKNVEYFDKVVKGDITPTIQEAFKYYQSSTGASTEPPQRLERYKWLCSIILKE